MPVLFDQIRCQLQTLLPVFGVERQAAGILASFDTLCRESLNIELRQRAPEFSRINSDGTPFQFALRLGHQGPPPLQFLGEAGGPGCGMAERRRASFQSLGALAQACGVARQLEQILPAVRQLAPEREIDLFEAASGIFWFALSFSPDASPSLTVYANACWGSDTARWRRLADVAAFFGLTQRWQPLLTLVPAGLSPLGVALTLNSKSPTSGRVYLHAFGQPLSVYRNLFQAAALTQGAAGAFDGFARHALRDEALYPTRSAVFSVEWSGAEMAGAKFELCAHCAFAHETQAADLISRWLTGAGFDDRIYRAMLGRLSRGRALSNCGLPSLHAYVGVGVRKTEHYASVYLNPGPALELA